MSPDLIQTAGFQTF